MSGSQLHHFCVQFRVFGDESALISEVHSQALDQSARQHERLLDGRKHARHPQPHECQRLKAVVGNHDGNGHE